MQTIIPDKNWLEQESKTRDVLSFCPYANSHRCPRYYESLVLLSRINMIAGMTSEKVAELEEFWNRTIFSSLCNEEVPSVSTDENGSLSSVAHFCPEVSFKYLGYYASYLHKYIDEIDKGFGIRRAERDGLENDWRYSWMSVSATFYLDCEIFNNVKQFNEGQGGSFLNRLHPNIIQQISRMDGCLDTNDPAGALHAAANILETMAKDIAQNPKVANQTLGGFFEQFKKKSKLPQHLIDAVLGIYKLRNEIHTAGHGGLNKPDLTMVEAIAIAAMTKAILEIEYRSKSI